MSVIFPKRAVHLRERMDDVTCDSALLNSTYKQFYIVNQVLSGWRRIYESYLRPRLYSGATLLDIGCGGGDVLRSLAVWLRQDGLSVSLLGIDPDVRALEYTRGRAFPPNVRFEQATSRALLYERRQFDFVISNHLLHHLKDDEVYSLCKDSEGLARQMVIHNDIRRSSLAYLSFATTKLVFWKSFITEDGLSSIRRSFTWQELQQVIPSRWRVEPMIPYRNLLIWEKQ
jgi:2-polyprenyl-3-methyl-5-hydroxy-6-metoxy-1,4-benzoquinol methylase